MHQITSNSDSISICVLDNDPSTLSTTSEVLSSAGWKLRPFIYRESILKYAAIRKARKVLMETELANLIEQPCIEHQNGRPFESLLFHNHKEIDFGYCA